MRPTASQLLARHLRVWFSFDVLVDEARCDCRRDLKAGDPIAVREERARGPRPLGGVIVGHVMCIPCGTRALREHARVVADLEWRVEREAAELAEERARALAEQMLTYESPPEDASLLEGALTLDEPLPAAAELAPPSALKEARAAAVATERRSGFEPSHALIDRQRFDALSSLADVHGVPPRRERETDEQLRARILESWGQR
jgi:hypothetical protein